MTQVKIGTMKKNQMKRYVSDRKHLSIDAHGGYRMIIRNPSKKLQNVNRARSDSF